MNVQRRIKKKMEMDREGTTDRKVVLPILAQELGCSLSATRTSDGKLLEEEVIRRIQEAARSIREARLWWITLLSAIASIISALAAWTAVTRSFGLT